MTQPAAGGLMAPPPDPSTFPPVDQDVSAVRQSNWDHPQFRHWAFWNMEKIPLRMVEFPRGTGPVAALRPAHRDLGGVRIPLYGRQMALDEWREAFTNNGIIVVRGDEIIHESYGFGMSMENRHTIMSITKTTVCAVIGDLVLAGKIRLDAKVREYVPEIGSAYADATIQDTLDMNVTNDYSEEYADPDADVYAQQSAYDWYPDPENRWPGGNRQYLATLTSSDIAGTGETQYKSANTDVLQWAIENVTGRNFNDLVADLWSRLGAGSSAFWTVDRTGHGVASGGFVMTLRDLARYGQLWANGGVARSGERLIPAAWIEQTMDTSRGTTYYYDGFRYHNQIVTNGRVLLHGGWAGQLMWADTQTGLVVAFMSGYRNPAGSDGELMTARRALCEAITAAVS